jgi:hypothetical protein
MSVIKSRTKEYRTWDRMVRKCHDQNHDKYAWYGARGIAVCPAWRESFDVFLADMGPAPTPSHTIEREDNEKGYEPSNCVWATMKEQGQNRRTSKHLEHKGARRTIAGWAEFKGMDRRILWKRLKAGWSTADAIDTPVAPRTKKATVLTLPSRDGGNHELRMAA